MYCSTVCVYTYTVNCRHWAWSHYHFNAPPSPEEACHHCEVPHKRMICKIKDTTLAGIYAIIPEVMFVVKHTLMFSRHWISSAAPTDLCSPWRHFSLCFRSTCALSLYVQVEWKRDDLYHHISDPIPTNPHNLPSLAHSHLCSLLLLCCKVRRQWFYFLPCLFQLSLCSI